jgi:hypothetical protein
LYLFPTHSSPHLRTQPLSLYSLGPTKSAWAPPFRTCLATQVRVAMAAGVAVISMSVLPTRLWMSQVRRGQAHRAGHMCTSCGVCDGPPLQLHSQRCKDTLEGDMHCPVHLNLACVHCHPGCLQLSRLGALCAFIFVMVSLGADGVPPLLQVRVHPSEQSTSSNQYDLSPTLGPALKAPGSAVMFPKINNRHVWSTGACWRAKRTCAPCASAQSRGVNASNRAHMCNLKSCLTCATRRAVSHVQPEELSQTMFISMLVDTCNTPWSRWAACAATHGLPLRHPPCLLHHHHT